MRVRRGVLFILILVMLMQMLLPAVVQAQKATETEQAADVETAAEAQEEEKVVRVGWYESAFHRTDEFGRRSGYGYEYQQRVAIYTGWTYEYVEGSWSELFEMLVAGDLDLLSDVSYTPERAEKILYSAEAMGSEDYHVFIAPDNVEIRPDDFSTFNGKKVGVNKNSIQEQLFIDWEKAHDVEADIVELSVKTPEMLQMLADGEIDMLVTLDTYGNSADVIPVCKVGAADSYFGINKKRPDIKRELDVAMNRIFEDNRDFNLEMTEKFNKASAVNNFLTPDEKKWVDEHGVIRVGYRANFLPFCGQDEQTGELTGMLADFLVFASTCEKNAVLEFEPHVYSTTEEAIQALTAGEIDCLFPVSLSAYDGEQQDVIITDPLVATEMYAMVRTADQQGVSRDREMKAAIGRGDPSFETFLKDYFPNWKIVYYDDGISAFHAVGTGEADCVLVSNYRINRMSNLGAKNKLTTLSTGEALTLSFALRREDDCLYSILNKIGRLYPDEILNSSLTNYAFFTEKVTFGDFLRDNLTIVIAIAAIIVAVILILLLRNARSMIRVNEGRQLISETERDSLTGLYNRNYFVAYANRLFREHPERPMDAIVMNIERFHTLNSLNGRDFGDEVLRRLSSAVEGFLRETEGIACRTDGDFFDIYCAHQEDYQALLSKFQAEMDEIALNVDIRLRMGVMPFQENMEPEQMFDRAWSACTMVRGNYKVHLMIYDEELRRRDRLGQRLRHDFTRALKQHELEVYYQPKYAIQGDQPQLISAEALVRWYHPELGLISPDDFIPLFEQSGQISALDDYVWTESARQIAEWKEKYNVTLPISVNISRVDVFDASLEETLDKIVEQNGLDRKDLKLEITESAYTENADHLICIIGQLREKGYEIEMDDFGSGYSSLNMLSSMPIDVLKMDIAFIRNIEKSERDLRLVELILDIARYLKVPVIAEGVETEGQLQLLKQAGCDVVQGYYFFKPLPAGEFEEKVLKSELTKG